MAGMIGNIERRLSQNSASDTIGRFAIGIISCVVFVGGILIVASVRKGIQTLSATRTGLRISLDAAGVNSRDAIQTMNG